MLGITVELPDALAEEARAAGILEPDYPASLLRNEIRRRKVDKLFAAADRLSASEVQISEEDVRTEIEAHRREKRRS